MLTVVDSVTVFERHRSLLLGVAYRMLGSMWDAEDVVQDAYTRWARIEQDVRDPRAFLLTVVTRIALDHLKSAKVTREAYVGPWLPEPVATGTLGPMDTAELRDSVAYATVHLMERMSPPERAVFRGPTLDVNGQPAGVLYVAGEPRMCALRVERDRIEEIYVVNNPDKLQHVPLSR